MIRAVAALVWQWGAPTDSFLRFGDSDSYWYLARTIADGTPYQYGSPNSKIFRAPLYPMFISPWTKFLPNGARFSWNAILAARLAGCVLGAGCIGLTIRLASKLSDGNRVSYHKRSITAHSIGLLAGLLAMLYPGAIGMSIFVLSESLFCPLMLLCLLATHRAIESTLPNKKGRAWVWMLVAGMLSGAACLTRPSWSLWPAILFPYLFFTMKWRDWVACCALFCIGICLAMCPWWVRNYNITGKFVPTTLQVGASLYDGWHPGASGASDEDMRFVEAFAKEQIDDDQVLLNRGSQLEGTYEWRLDRKLKNAAIHWAYENSSDARRLGLVKLIKTWSPLPVARELGSDVVRWAEAIGYTSIMCFGLIGVWQCRKLPGAWLYVIPCIYFALLHMFFIGSVRYRQPAVLVLCALGGVGIIATARWINERLARNKTNIANIDGSIISNNVTADSSPT